MRRVAGGRVSRIEAELSSDTRSGAGWVIALGVLQIAAGAVGVAFALLATIAAVLTLGIVLLVAGASQLAGAVWARDRGGFFLIDLSTLGTTMNGRHVPRGFDERDGTKRENGAETALPDARAVGLADTVFLEFHVVR